MDRAASKGCRSAGRRRIPRPPRHSQAASLCRISTVLLGGFSLRPGVPIPGGIPDQQSEEAAQPVLGVRGRVASNPHRTQLRPVPAGVLGFFPVPGILHVVAPAVSTSRLASFGSTACRWVAGASDHERLWSRIRIERPFNNQCGPPERRREPLIGWFIHEPGNSGQLAARRARGESRTTMAEGTEGLARRGKRRTDRGLPRSAYSRCRVLALGSRWASPSSPARSWRASR